MTAQDVNQEGHNKRSIALYGLPSHIKSIDLQKIFADHGAITLVECPTLDSVIQSQMEQQGLLNDHYSKERKIQKEKDFRLAETLLQESIEFDKQYADVLTDSWGSPEAAKKMMSAQEEMSEKFTKFDMLNEEKLNAFVRVLGQLQLEGLQIEKSKRTFESILKETGNESSAGIGQETENLIASKKTQLEGAL